MLPFLSMYAIDKSEWMPASANHIHRLTEASAPDQVRTLVCIHNHEYSVGVYTDGSAATRSDWTVYLVSWPEGVLLEKQVLSGGAPAAVKTGYGGGSGASPSMAYFPWLFERFASDKMVFDHGYVASQDFSPFGNLLAALSTGGALKVWDLQAKQVVFAPASEDWKELDMRALQFSPDGSLLAVAGGGGLRLISAADGSIQAEVRGLAHDIGDDLYDIDFSADGSRLLAGGYNFYREYAVPSLEVINEVPFEKMQITRVRFSEDGARIIAQARGPALSSGVYIWRLADKSEEFFQRAEGTGLWITMPNSDLLAMASEKSSTIWIYHTALGEQGIDKWGFRISSGTLQGFRESTGIRLMSVDPRGSFFAAVNDENHLIVWDVETRRALSIRSGGKDDISALAFSPDGSALAVGYKSGMIELWPVLP